MVVSRVVLVVFAAVRDRVEVLMLEVVILQIQVVVGSRSHHSGDWPAQRGNTSDSGVACAGKPV